MSSCGCLHSPVMTCCSRCYEWLFDDALAAKDLARYRESGPDKTTRALLELLKTRGVSGATILDVGGGIGAIQHELLGAGAASATDVDASSAYIRAAREEAERRGNAGKVAFLHGDAVAMAD